MPKQEKVRVNVKERVEDDTIDLSLSELTEIPVKDIASFKRATILDLSNNKIISLGKSFSTLTHLTKLDLSKNQIKYLPEDFGNLRSLRHLDLYNNRIEHLPLSIGNLQNLRDMAKKAANRNKPEKKTREIQGKSKQELREEKIKADKEAKAIKLSKSKTKRLERTKIISKKNKRGQPIMKDRIEFLLKKIQDMKKR